MAKFKVDDSLKFIKVVRSELDTVLAPILQEFLTAKNAVNTETKLGIYLYTETRPVIVASITISNGIGKATLYSAYVDGGFTSPVFTYAGLDLYLSRSSINASYIAYLEDYSKTLKLFKNDTVYS